MSTLPFLQTATVTRNGDAVATGMPISIWPAPARVSDVGGAYDHEGEAPLSAWASLCQSNTRVVVDGKTYTVVDAQPQTFVPHVALVLRRVSAGGI